MADTRGGIKKVIRFIKCFFEGGNANIWVVFRKKVVSLQREIDKMMMT